MVCVQVIWLMEYQPKIILINVWLNYQELIANLQLLLLHEEQSYIIQNHRHVEHVLMFVSVKIFYILLNGYQQTY